MAEETRCVLRLYGSGGGVTGRLQGGKLLRQRLAQKSVSAKNESDRSTHGFSP